MKYSFTAINSQEKSITGEVQAVDIAEAEKKLKNFGYKNVLIKEGNLFNKQTYKVLNEISIFNHVSAKDVVNISRQMSALLGAGVSVIKSFQLLVDEANKGKLKIILTNIIENIRTGVSVSNSLSKHPEVFDDFYVNMIKSGEESGKLSYTFTYLADYLDRNYALNSKVRNSMIYPAFVVLTFISVMLLVFTTVIPKLSVVLTESNVELPFITQIVLGISNFILSYGIYVIAILFVGGFYAYLTLRNTADVKIFLDNLKIKIPIIKNIFRMFYVTRIADNIETLLGSGVTLTKSIQISSDVVGNYYYKKLMDKSLVDVKSGMSFSQSLSHNRDLIPNAMIQMVKIGEETGEIGKLMGNIAKFYQREINGAVDTMISLIEPIMIVLLGLGVGLLLISVLLPIYNLTSAF